MHGHVPRAVRVKRPAEGVVSVPPVPSGKDAVIPPPPPPAADTARLPAGPGHAASGRGAAGARCWGSRRSRGRRAIAPRVSSGHPPEWKMPVPGELALSHGEFSPRGRCCPLPSPSGLGASPACSCPGARWQELEHSVLSAAQPRCLVVGSHHGAHPLAPGPFAGHAPCFWGADPFLGMGVRCPVLPPQPLG